MRKWFSRINMALALAAVTAVFLTSVLLTCLHTGPVPAQGIRVTTQYPAAPGKAAYLHAGIGAGHAGHHQIQDDEIKALACGHPGG